MAKVIMTKEELASGLEDAIYDNGFKEIWLSEDKFLGYDDSWLEVIFDELTDNYVEALTNELSKGEYDKELEEMIYGEFGNSIYINAYDLPTSYDVNCGTIECEVSLSYVELGNDGNTDVNPKLLEKVGLSEYEFLEIADEVFSNYDDTVTLEGESTEEFIEKNLKWLNTDLIAQYADVEFEYEVAA